jgi:hypothetical protein
VPVRIGRRLVWGLQLDGRRLEDHPPRIIAWVVDGPSIRVLPSEDMTPVRTWWAWRRERSGSDAC